MFYRQLRINIFMSKMAGNMKKPTHWLLSKTCDTEEQNIRHKNEHTTGELFRVNEVLNKVILQLMLSAFKTHTLCKFDVYFMQNLEPVTLQGIDKEKKPHLILANLGFFGPFVIKMEMRGFLQGFVTTFDTQTTSVFPELDAPLT